MKIIKALAVASLAAFFVGSVSAQTGTVTNHAVPIGKGAGVQGFKSVGPCTAAFTLIFAGASVDPACGQIDLGAGVTGTLPVLNGGTGTTTVLAALQAWGLQVPNLVHKAAPVAADKIGFYDVAGTAYKYATLTELLASVVSGVSSIAGNTGAFTLGYGLTNATNDLRASFTTATNSLGGNVGLTQNVEALGPTIAQGTSGTWCAYGQVTVGSTTSDQIKVRIWDGSTTISSGVGQNITGDFITVHLSGCIASPAGNIRFGVTTPAAAGGNMVFNASGFSKDSTLTVVRVAP